MPGNYYTVPKSNEFPRPVASSKLGAPAFPPDDYDRVLYAAKNASTVWEEAARTGQWDKVDRFCFWLAVFDKVWEW